MWTLIWQLIVNCNLKTFTYKLKCELFWLNILKAFPQGDLSSQRLFMQRKLSSHRDSIFPKKKKKDRSLSNETRECPACLFVLQTRVYFSATRGKTQGGRHLQEKQEREWKNLLCEENQHLCKTSLELQVKQTSTDPEIPKDTQQQQTLNTNEVHAKGACWKDLLQK